MIHQPQLNTLTSEDKQLGWDLLNSLYPAPDFPLRHNPQALATGHITHYQQLEPNTWLKFKQRTQQTQLTLESALLAIYAEILACWGKNSCFSLSLDSGDSTINLLAIDYSQSQSFLERGRIIQTQLEQNTVYKLTVLDHLFSQANTEQKEKLRSILSFSFKSNYQKKSIANSRSKTYLQFAYTESETVEIKLNTLENLFPANMAKDMLTASCHLLTKKKQLGTKKLDS